MKVVLVTVQQVDLKTDEKVGIPIEAVLTDGRYQEEWIGGLLLDMIKRSKDESK